MGLEPYRFEPIESQSGESSESIASSSQKSATSSGAGGGVEWCLCGSCREMRYEHERGCCLKVPTIAEKVDGECFLYLYVHSSQLLELEMRHLFTMTKQREQREVKRA